MTSSLLTVQHLASGLTSQREDSGSRQHDHQSQPRFALEEQGSSTLTSKRGRATVMPVGKLPSSPDGSAGMAGMKQVISRTLPGLGQVSRITECGISGFVALDHQLIAHFGSTLEDGVSG